MYAGTLKHSPMRFKILSLGLLVSASAATAAVNADPADAFLRLYQRSQRVEKREQAGQLAAALEEAKTLGRDLNQFTADFPSWNSAVVDFRQRRTRETVTRLEKRVSAEGATVAAQPAQGDNPADLFLRLYQHYQRTEKSEAAGQLDEALHEAKSLSKDLSAFIQQFPNWNPAILRYRQARVDEAVARLEKRLRPLGGR